MIKVSLLVTAGPQRPGAITALHTAQAVARSSHQLYRIFFYGDGVHLANRLARRGDLACDAQRGWQTLVAEHGWPASVCHNPTILEYFSRTGRAVVKAALQVGAAPGLRR